MKQCAYLQCGGRGWGVAVAEGHSPIEQINRIFHSKFDNFPFHNTI